MTLWSVENTTKLFIGVGTGIFCASETLWFLQRVISCNFDIDFVMQFGPFTFDNCHAAIIIFQTYCKYSSFKRITDYTEKHFWTLESAQLEAQREILFDMSIFKYVMIISLNLVISTAIVYQPFNGIHYDETMFLLIEWLKHGYLPKFMEYGVIAVNFLKLFPQAYFMLAYLFQLCYLINSYRYQATMVKWELMNITKDLSGSDANEMVDDRICQTAIKNRLKICVKHHIILCHYANEVIDYFYYTFMWQIVSGITLFVSLVYIFIFHNAANKPIAVMTNIVGAYFAAFLYTVYGQLFQEQTNVMLDAAGESNWENFNKSNRKTLLIFMINLKRSYTIVSWGVISLNFEMFIWFSNKIFGLLGVVGTMVSK